MNSVFAGASGSGAGGDGPAERPKKDGRLRVLLRRRTGGEGEVDSELADDDPSMSVRERCMRLGRARGPPGTDGALVICTGRGFGAVVVVVGCLVRRRCGACLVLMLSFLVLECLPREKKPPDILDPVERDVACDNGDPTVIVE